MPLISDRKASQMNGWPGSFLMTRPVNAPAWVQVTV